MKKVLIVEDDLDIAELLTIHLSDLECHVMHSSNGSSGLSLAREGNFDLIILDIGLPGITGLEICSKLRRDGDITPIMMLTARSDETDRITGLEFGADVYITKPFSILEFKAKFNALFRRIDLERTQLVQNDDSVTLEFGDLVVDLEKKAASLKGERLNLTPKEYQLLALLSSNPGKTYSRENLLALVWDYQFQGFEHTVNTHINRLRAKIEPDMRNPHYVLTTWGLGYRFKDE